MKKRSQREIPVFARAATKPKDGTKDAPKTDAHSAPTPRASSPPPPARVRPPATSAKSGQRGK